jgi:hypothetical protein
MLSLSRLATLSLSILLVTTGTPAHAGAPVPSDAKPAKSISLKAAQKMYGGFAKSTAASLGKDPFKMTESRNEDGLLELHSITVDRRGNGRLVEYGATTILLVSNKLYLSPREVNESYGEFELEIARDLGYRIDENWSTVSGLDPKAVRSDFRSTAAPDTALLNWFKADLAKASWRPASKDGKSGTLIVEQARQELLASEVGFDFSLPARSILITVKSGKVTGIIEKDESSTVTTRYESYTKLLSKPSGPIVDFDKILLDDRYAAGWAKEQAINLLRRAGREAAALAAFDGNEAISDENWDEALQGDDAVRRTVTGFEVRVIYPGYPVSKADQEFLFCDSDPSGWARYSDSQPSADQLLEGPCPVLGKGSGGPGGLIPVGKATQE